MSWLSGLFESSVKGEGFQEIPSTPIQNAARGYLQNLYGADIKFPEQKVGDMTAAEKQGQDILGEFLADGESPERAGALEYLQNTLSSPLNVMELPEIKAMFSTIENQTVDLVNSALRRTQREGMGTSGPQGSAVGREIARGKTSMVAAVAPYMAEQRSNKLTAANMINNLVTSQEGTTLNKLNAASTVGALPREIENQKAMAEFQKKLNDLLAPYNIKAPIASQLLNETSYMYNPGVTTPSLMSQLMPAVGAGLGAYSALKPLSPKTTI